MSDLNVLVVGASIAGPTTAYWLAKAGATVTVVERFPSLRLNGQSIDIRTSGVTIMRKMPGMEEAVRRMTTKEEGLSFVDGKGRQAATLMATGNPDQQAFTSEFEIFRGDLAKIIFDLTKDHPRIKYVFDESIVSMKQQKQKGGDADDDGPVTVEFANGMPTAEYDLVVACDGATSRTRAMAFGGGVRDYIVPMNSYAAYWTHPADLMDGTKIARIFSAPGGKGSGVRPDPTGASRAMAMQVRPRKGPDCTVDFREASKQGDATLRQYIRKEFTGIGWKTDELMESMMTATDFYASEVVQVKAPSMYVGRMALVGDAGYCPSPFSGAGTTLAITGAYTLAGEIAAHKGDLKAGLKAYEVRMRPIVDKFQDIPPIIGVFAPQTALGIRFRNAILGFLTWSGIFDLISRILGGSFGKDETNLPEYPWVE